MALSGCASLEDYPLGVCGNSVVENDAAVQEQCDTHVDEGQACGAPDGLAPCRFTCALQDEADPTSAASCPEGFSCGLDAVCHRGTGTFALGSVETNFSFGSRVGDFDGSGTGDVMTAGLARLDISSFDASGALTYRQTLGGSQLLLPDIGDLDGPNAEGRSYDDAVFAQDGDIVVALGSDTGISPRPYAGVRLEIAPPVLFFSIPGAISPDLGLHAAAVFVGPKTIVQLNGQTVEDITDDWPADELPFHALAANLDAPESTCSEMLFSYGVTLYAWRPCPVGDFRQGYLPPTPLFFERQEGSELPLQAGAPAVVDINGDDVVDIVVEINECVKEAKDHAICQRAEPEAPSDIECCYFYAAFGQIDEEGVATGQFASPDGVPDTLARVASSTLTIPSGVEGEPPTYLMNHPRAWGDFDGDEHIDFVTPVAVVRDFFRPVVGPNLAAFNSGFPWIDVEVADVDRDGLDDIVAVPEGSPSVDYLRGDRAGTMARQGIQIERPFGEILLGDFDGDARVDVVGKAISDDFLAEELSVLFFDDRTFAEQRTIGRYAIDFGDPSTDEDDKGAVLQLIAAPLVTNFDPIADLAAITTYEQDGEERVAIALYEGRPNRELIAPIVIIDETTQSTVDVRATTFGRFDDVGPTIVADAYAIALDATTLDIVGAPRAIAAIQGSGSLFPEGIENTPELLLLASGNVDADPLDELVVGMPGCDRDPACQPPLVCCQPGTEMSRLLVLDSVGGELTAQVAPVPLDIATVNAIFEDDIISLGRVEVVDLNADGVGEILVQGVARSEGKLARRGRLIASVGGVLTPMPFPESIAAGAETLPIDVVGFSVLEASSQGARLALATSEGLLMTTVDPATFAFGPLEVILGADGVPLALGEVRGVESGDLTGDGIVDLVVTRGASTEIHVGLESLTPPEEAP